MQTLELKDELAIQLNQVAKQAHLSTNDLIEQLLKQYINKEIKTVTFDDFIGILKDSPTFEGDPLAIQQKMRNEWD